MASQRLKFNSLFFNNILFFNLNFQFDIFLYFIQYYFTSYFCRIHEFDIFINLNNLECTIIKAFLNFEF